MVFRFFFEGRVEGVGGGFCNPQLSAPTVSSFKKSLINDVNLLKPSRYYVYGCRVLNVLHTRLRHRSSNLDADLFRVNLINDPGYSHYIV
jgi:hypothetical protein